jgi:hypothetical protein
MSRKRGADEGALESHGVKKMREMMDGLGALSVISRAPTTEPNNCPKRARCMRTSSAGSKEVHVVLRGLDLHELGSELRRKRPLKKARGAAEKCHAQDEDHAADLDGDLDDDIEAVEAVELKQAIPQQSALVTVAPPSRSQFTTEIRGAGVNARREHRLGQLDARDLMDHITGSSSGEAMVPHSPIIAHFRSLLGQSCAQTTTVWIAATNGTVYKLEQRADMLQFKAMPPGYLPPAAGGCAGGAPSSDFEMGEHDTVGMPASEDITDDFEVEDITHDS